MDENEIIEKKIKKEKRKRVIFVFIILISIVLSAIVTFIKERHVYDSMTDLKPIIYIYPKEETDVSIKVGHPENLTCTYPKYEDGWNVLAKSNGDLIDLKTGRNLYALYWEGLDKSKKQNYKDGFVVKGDEVATFLEEKLEILGLNERETEEFIVYWLPILEKNEYNYIRFFEKEEIDENMPLEINPKPETIIRVLMGWKKLDKQIEVQEQQLERVERKGYTVVEWGGTEFNSFKIK